MAYREADAAHPFALKRLNRPKHPKTFARFRREQEALQSVVHPGIVKFVEASDAETEPYYVMEYVEGAVDLGRLIWSDLAEPRIDRNPSGALAFVAKVADCLHAAHQAGIIHRDVKPANILVKPDGSPVVIDFGCCQLEGDLDQLTIDDEGVGARNFMAYECEAGTGGAPSAESDVFSLGKILWCIVTGKKPFMGEAAGFIDMNRPDQLLKDEPAAGFLVDAMLKSVRRSKEHRSSTAANFASLCRELALEVRAGGLHPLFTHARCPVCMSKNVQVGSGRLHHPAGEYADVGHFIGNNNPRLEGVWCLRCGHLSMRDRLMYELRRNELMAAGQ